jgi:hypothetical protein
MRRRSRRKCRAGGNPEFRREAPFRRDALNTLLALVAICALYVGTLYVILHRYAVAFPCFGTTLALCVVLFFTWYKNLPARELVLLDEKPAAPPVELPVGAQET